MKLLFDNNLSHKLIARPSDIFPHSTHVMIENLDESEDIEILKFVIPAQAGMPGLASASFEHA